MSSLRVVLAGYGTVGSSFHQLVEDRREGIADDHGLEARVVAVARSRGAWVDPDGLEPGALPDDEARDLAAEDLVDEVEADAFVQATPSDLETGEPARTQLLAALDRGLHAVTANKGAPVRAFDELEDRAREAGVAFTCEAAAGAALPLLNTSRRCLRGNPVRRVEGVLNGTSNYILTRMAEEGRTMDQVLEEAQALGIAEADPTLDVGGADAAAKAVILGRGILGADVTLEDLDVTGIRAVTPDAVELAYDHGYSVRLVAAVDGDGEGSVGPRLVDRASPLDVTGTTNAVRLHTEDAGPVTVTGRGAGGRETASALLSETLAVATR
jgi:homoserine dehydrogenase